MMKKVYLFVLIAILAVSSIYVLSDDNNISCADGTNVAEIGEIEYSTLASAIDAASTNETTIILISDVTECVIIGNGQIITLDLNGYKLTGSTDHTIVNSGILTIIDGSVGKTGTVDNTIHQKADLYNYGTVTLSGGQYTRSAESGTTNTFYSIVNLGTMVINKGVTVTNASGTTSSLVENGGYIEATTHLTINGGTFTGGLNTVKNDSYGILVINGGIFENTVQTVIFNANVATVNGGTFTLDASSRLGNVTVYNRSWEPDYSGTAGEITIDGGTFTSSNDNYCLYVYSGTAVIDSDSVFLDVYVKDNGNLIINGTLSTGMICNLGTVINNGNVVNYDSVALNSGTFTNNGTFMLNGSLDSSGGIFENNGFFVGTSPIYEWFHNNSSEHEDIESKTVTSTEGNVTISPDTAGNGLVITLPSNVSDIESLTVDLGNGVSVNIPGSLLSDNGMIAVAVTSVTTDYSGTSYELSIVGTGNSTISVTLPYSGSSYGVVYYLNGGELVDMDGTVGSGTITFNTTHNSIYIVTDEIPSYTVRLNAGLGYTIFSSTGSSFSISPFGTAYFTVMPLSDYKVSTVTASNGTVSYLGGYQYSISGVTSDSVITVSAIYASSDTSSGDSDDSDNSVIYVAAAACAAVIAMLSAVAILKRK